MRNSLLLFFVVLAACNNSSTTDNAEESHSVPPVSNDTVAIAIPSNNTNSVRQVVFLKKSDGFVEGYGDSKMENGKMVFKNTGAINFGSAPVLEKRPCSN